MSTSFIPDPYVNYHNPHSAAALDQPPDFTVDERDRPLHGISRRWRRERRRRKVGRAYDMACEIARLLPQHARVLDVGCGNGYIAHHLSALLGSSVTGIDLSEGVEGQIDFKPFDGRHFPVGDASYDAALFCYVLHHAQDLDEIMCELRRVLATRALVVVYEDIPATWWDSFVCRVHDLKWRRRTGPCRFRLEDQWRQIFSEAGFEILKEKRLARWRNLAHPVSRWLYVLRQRS